MSLFQSNEIITKHKVAIHLTIFLLSFVLSELFAFEVIFFTKNFVSGIEISIIIFTFSYLFLLILWYFIENLQLNRLNFSFTFDKIKIHLIIIWFYSILIYFFGLISYKFIFINSVYSVSYIYGFTKDMIYYVIFIIVPISLYHLSGLVEESSYDEKEEKISDFTLIYEGLIGISFGILLVVVQMEVNYFNYEEFLNLPIIMQEMAQIHVVIRGFVVFITFFLIYLHYFFVIRDWRELVKSKKNLLKI
jgi:hypothetical protein